MRNWPLQIMVYGGGEALDGSGALAPEIARQLSDLAQVCTNPFVAATAQIDATDQPTKRLVLDPQGRQPVTSLPNVNVGDPFNLIDFVDWSAAVCPADRTILVLSGHGVAWQDAQVDAALGTRGTSAVRRVAGGSSPQKMVSHSRSLFGKPVSRERSKSRALLLDGHSRDYLTNAELGAVLDKVTTRLGRPIDVIVFDACLMSAWEILQELRGSCSTVVASIDELSSAGIPLNGPAVQLTALHGMVSPADIGLIFTKSFVPQNVFDSCVAINLQEDSWGDALSAIRRCCEVLLGWIQEDHAHAEAFIHSLAIASTSLVQYRGGGLADVTSLASALTQLDGAPADVATNALFMAQSLKSCVVGHVAGDDYRKAFGMSIFSPTSQRVFKANRADYSRLSFPIATGWLAVLDAAFGFKSDTARFVG